jgi:hypothetical protein
MPRKKIIAFIPKRWLDIVIPILEEGDHQAIRWTLTAELDLPQIGLSCKQAAYDHILQVLRTPNQPGEIIRDMRDKLDQTLCETWAFLAPHPLKVPTPLYVKIGLHQNQIVLNLFSIHIDRKNTLSAEFAALLKKQS